MSIFLESRLVDNKEHARLEMHYDLNHEDIMKETDRFYSIVMTTTMTMTKAMAMTMAMTMTMAITMTIEKYSVN